jgi:hypothetical protein
MKIVENGKGLHFNFVAPRVAIDSHPPYVSIASTRRRISELGRVRSQSIEEKEREMRK